MSRSIFEQFEKDAEIALSEITSDTSLSDKQISSMIQEVLSKSTDDLREQFKYNAKSIINKKRRTDRAFERRNFERWQPAFDLFEIMVVISQEIGEIADNEFRSNAVKINDYKFEAIAHLYPKAILICGEILCLLRGGFPDAALSRWRSLHEVNVIAMFLKQSDRDTSMKYLASFDFQALKAAKNYIKYSQRANLEPFGEQEYAALEGRCAALEASIGCRLDGEYDWANGALDKRKVNFADIERFVQMDHWRPRYKWACQHIHAGHQPVGRMLGSSEATHPIFLVGPSNSGFTDPLQMSAISLAEITSTFVLFEPTLLGTVMSKIMLDFSEELGPLAFDVEKRSFEEHLQKNSR